MCVQVSNHLLLSERPLAFDESEQGDRFRLASAGFHVQQGDLRAALRDVEALSPAVRERSAATREWIRDVRGRLALQQAVALVEAEAVLLPHRVPAPVTATVPRV